MECRLFSVKGRVQGVWFRESTRREAAALGITGYAKNMADRSVEVLACGDSAALQRLAEWLEVGPPAARVSQVDWSPVDCPPPDSFSTR
jgi:acylphosphatase